MKIFTNDDTFYVQIFGVIKSFFPKENIINDDRGDIKAIFNENGVKIVFFDEHFFIGEKELKSYDYEHNNYHTLAKRKIYELLSFKTSKVNSWGILTGVRPSKLYRKIMSETNSREKTSEILRNLYLLKDEKISLLEEVFENQKTTIDRNYDRINYISIPFCPSKCSYCTFTTGCYNDYKDAYIDKLLQEINYGKSFFDGSKIVYIGGGTPTYLSDKNFERVLSLVASLSDYDEFTLEAGRPDTIDENKLAIMKCYGVNRISINPQTFSDDTLKKVGRKHSVKDIYDSYNLAVKYGFNNINMDIILGLPNETIDDVKNTVENLLQIRPSSITVHCLAIKKNNNLSEKYIDEHIKHNMLIKNMMDIAVNKLTNNQYDKYYIYRQKNIGGNQENIGFCLEGSESHYNILMMEDLTDVYGFGAGSVSKRYENEKIKRVVLPKNIKSYIDKSNELINKRELLFR